MIHYYNVNNGYTYALGFRMHTGVETRRSSANYAPFQVSVTQDGCSSNKTTQQDTTVFEFDSLELPIININVRDNGNPIEQMGSPLTQNPARFR